MVTKQQCKDAFNLYKMKDSTARLIENFIYSINNARQTVGYHGIVGTSKQLLDSLDKDTDNLIKKAERNLDRAKLEKRKAEEKLDVLWNQYELEHGASPFAKTR